MYTQFETWQQLDEDLESRVSADRTFVIDLKINGYKQNPYLQGRPQKDGRLLVELSSGNYMKPVPTDQQHRTLLGLGWNRPSGTEYPNYYKFLEKKDSNPSSVAEMFVSALQVGLALSPTQICI